MFVRGFRRDYKRGGGGGGGLTYNWNRKKRFETNMYRFLIKVQNAQERTKLYPLLKPHNKLNWRKKSLLGGLYTRRGSGGGGGRS